MIERTAYAKINLALHVTGQREDGYHLLDTLVVFLKAGDLIQVDEPHHPHGPLSVVTDGPFSEGLSSGPENLVTAAALALRSSIIAKGGEPQPAIIHLEKNLPVASGIGGGSADAAATLLALQEFWQSDCDLQEIGLTLGADVPMCLHSTPLRATGIGNEIELLNTSKPLHLLVVNPGRSVATPDVFRALASKDNTPITDIAGNRFPGSDAIKALRNDLQEPAFKIEPVIAGVLAAIDQSGSLMTRMSGSGATCFGIFATAEASQRACDTLKAEHPNWWCVASETTLA